jgi:hypothetical protein
MIRMVRYLYVVISGLFLVACSKSEDPVLKTTRTGFNPEENKEAVNRILQIKGFLEENRNFPKKSDPVSLSGFTYFPPKPFIIREIPPSGLDSIEIGNEINAFIPIRFTTTEFSNFFKPTRVFLRVSGAKSLWTVPFSPDQSLVDGSVPVIIPGLVNEGNIKMTLCAELACIFPGYENLRVVTDTVNFHLIVRPALRCNSLINGSNGIFIRKMDLGSAPGRVKVRFQTDGVPDRFDLKINGKYVLSSCPVLPGPTTIPGCKDPSCFIIIENQGWKEYQFNYIPSEGPFLEIFAVGWCAAENTGWNLQIGCPE